MNSFNQCPKCKEYHWTHENCNPIFLVYYEEYMGHEPKEIRAVNHENAALKFAAYYNTRSDYKLMNETIEIKVEKDGVVKFFSVGAEPDVHYTSSEIPSFSQDE